LYDLIPLVDLFAFAFFLFGWMGYAAYADIKAIGRRPITVVMKRLSAALVRAYAGA
jgi:uncharacterized membrane protein